MQALTKLDPAAIATAMEHAVSIKQNLCVHGPPGIGKTAIAGQTAAKLGMRLTVAPIATMDAADARFPQIADGRVSFVVADWLPGPDDDPTILFLDELNRGRPDVQNAFLGLCGRERRMGSYTLAAQHAILAAVNPLETSSGVNRMVDALADRFTHLEIAPDPKHVSWQGWAKANGMPPELIAFARNRPECMYQYAKGELVNPTYRGWEAVGRILLAQMPTAIERAMVEGTVGRGAAIECLGFIEEWRALLSVNVDAILMNPDTAPLPEPQRHGTRYALANALSRRMDVSNIGRCIRVLKRMSAEYVTMALQDATARDSKLGFTPEFTDWQVEHTATT